MLQKSRKRTTDTQTYLTCKQSEGVLGYLIHIIIVQMEKLVEIVRVTRAATGILIRHHDNDLCYPLNVPPYVEEGILCDRQWRLRSWDGTRCHARRKPYEYKVVYPAQESSLEPIGHQWENFEALNNAHSSRKKVIQFSDDTVGFLLLFVVVKHSDLLILSSERCSQLYELVQSR